MTDNKLSSSNIDILTGSVEKCTNSILALKNVMQKANEDLFSSKNSDINIKKLLGVCVKAELSSNGITLPSLLLPNLKIEQTSPQK